MPFVQHWFYRCAQCTREGIEGETGPFRTKREAKKYAEDHKEWHRKVRAGVCATCGHKAK